MAQQTFVHIRFCIILNSPWVLFSFWREKLFFCFLVLWTDSDQSPSPGIGRLLPASKNYVTLCPGLCLLTARPRNQASSVDPVTARRMSELGLPYATWWRQTVVRKLVMSRWRTKWIKTWTEASICPCLYPWMYIVHICLSISPSPISVSLPIIYLSN